VTLVFPRSQLIPRIVTAGRDTVAVRVPAPNVARDLIECVGHPIAAPSANRSSQISPTRAEHVLAGLDGLIDLVLDSGPTELGLESTVVDLTREPIRILRPGPVGIAEIEECLCGLVAVETNWGAGTETNRAGEAHVSPGMLPVHYAPRTLAWRVESADELMQIALPKRSAILVFGTCIVPKAVSFLRQWNFADARIAARELYSTLHDLDGLGLDLLVVVMPPDQPEWATVRDRLMRATRPASA
jgi:L-threonylcarbamoyladenylate synthase